MKNEKQCAIHDVMLSLSDTMKFIDWVSDKAYKRCINGCKYTTFFGRKFQINFVV